MKFNKLVPELAMSDYQKSLQFYTEVLGFEIKYQRPERGFAFLEFEGAQIMIEQYNGTWNTGKLEHPFGRGINFQFGVRNAKKLYDRIVAAGHPIFREMEEYAYRKDDVMLTGKEFLVQDPDGYLLRFSQSGKTVPVEGGKK